MDNIQKSVKILSQLYNNVNYWDEYGTSFIIFLVLMIILFLFHAYFYVKTHIQPLKKEWIKNRCSLKVLPFAGLINKPTDKTAIQYTEENFTYCIQNILNEISGTALQPLTFITHSLTGIFKGILSEIQNIRSMFNNLRNNVKSISEEIMGRLMNIMVPIQQVIIKVRDLFGKVQGVMTAGLYTLFGAYMTLQTLIGAIIQGLVTILVIIAATIAALMILVAIPVIGEFFIPILAADIAIFISIAVPTIIIIVFASQFLQLQTQSLIPSFCFDKNTIFSLNNGKQKTIQELKVGDKLINSNLVTAKIKVICNNTKMFRLNNTIVSGNHSVLYKSKWIKIKDHPLANEIKNYNDGVLYCINTEMKEILLDENIFCDWDEIHDEKYKNMNILKQDIHIKSDGGFQKNTIISLKNGNIKKISDVQIGDILQNGEIVYGVVEIYSNDLQQYELLINNEKFDIGNNIYYKINKKLYSSLDKDLIHNLKKTDNNELILYHLITNTKSFYLRGIEFMDYDSCVDFILKN